MLPNRKSLRKKGYNYRTNGRYFVTFCVQDRLQSLGLIENDIMHHSEIGQYCIQEIERLGNRLCVKVDEFVVMPDHVHILFHLDNTDVLSTRPYTLAYIPPYKGASVGSIIVFLKGNVKKFAKKNGIPFKWQGRFHDHIVRCDDEFFSIKQYIINNPKNRKKSIKAG